MQIDPDALPDDTAVLQQMLRTVLHQHGKLHTENDKLRLLIQRLSRHQFGRRSEQLSLEQLQFGFEDLEQTMGENQVGQDAAATPDPAKVPRGVIVRPAITARCMRLANSVPSNSTSCLHSCGCVSRAGRAMATGFCEDAVVVAPAPERPIDGSMATEALVAHVVVSKFASSFGSEFTVE